MCFHESDLCGATDYCVTFRWAEFGPVMLIPSVPGRKSWGQQSVWWPQDSVAYCCQHKSSCAVLSAAYLLSNKAGCADKQWSVVLPVLRWSLTASIYHGKLHRRLQDPVIWPGDTDAVENSLERSEDHFTRLFQRNVWIASVVFDIFSFRSRVSELREGIQHHRWSVFEGPDFQQRGWTHLLHHSTG